MTASLSSLLVLLLAGIASAQCPSSGFTQTSVLGELKRAPGATGYETAACTQADRHEARRNGYGTYASRPSATTTTRTKAYVVTDCASQACTAGGGVIRCLTVVNDAGNAWQVGPCSDNFDVRDFGAVCGDASTDTTAAQLMLSTLGVLNVPPKCNLVLLGQTSQTLLLDSVGEEIRCGAGATLSLSTRVCVGGNTPGGSCLVTADCDGGTCSGTAFATSGQDRTLIRSTAFGTAVTGCTIAANGIPHDGAGKGWAKCSGGAQTGMPCRWTCSNDATKACSSDGNCSGGGTCTKKGTCSGGTCGAAGLAPHGAGTVKLIDFSTVLYGSVRDVTVTDYVRGDPMIHIGAYADARGVKMLETAAALPTTGSPAHTAPAVTFGVALYGGLSAIVDNGPIWGAPAIYNACVNIAGIHCDTSHNRVFGGTNSNSITSPAIRIDGWHHRVIGNSVQGGYRHCVLGGTNATDVTFTGNRCLTAGVGPVVSAFGTGWEINGSNYLVGGAARCQGGANDGVTCGLTCDGGSNDGAACGWDVQCPGGGTCNANDACGAGIDCYADQCVVQLGGTPDVLASNANHSQVSDNLIGITGVGGCGVGLVDGQSHTEIKISDNEFLRTATSREDPPWNTAVRVAGNVDVLLLTGNYFGVRAGVEFEASPGTIAGVHAEGNTYKFGACSSASSSRGEVCDADADCPSGTCEPDLAAPLINWNPIFGAMLDRIPLPGLGPSGPCQDWMLYQGTGALYDAVKMSTSADYSVTRSTATTDRVIGIAVTTPVDGLPVLVQFCGKGKCKVSGTPSRGDDLVATNTAGTLATSGGSTVFAEVTKGGSSPVDCWVGK